MVPAEEDDDELEESDELSEEESEELEDEEDDDDEEPWFPLAYFRLDEPRRRLDGWPEKEKDVALAREKSRPDSRSCSR